MSPVVSPVTVPLPVTVSLSVPVASSPVR